MRFSLSLVGAAQLQMMAPHPLFLPVTASRDWKQSVSLAPGTEDFFTSMG